MSSLKRWEQVGQGEFHKWETEGDEMEGIWRGMREGKFGPLGTLETEKGAISFPLHTALLDRVKDLPLRAEIKIQYTGWKKTKAGADFKSFVVFVARPMDGISPAETSQPDAPDEEEVPF